MLHPENFENKIGFDRIREMLTGSCLFDLGIEASRKITFTNSVKEIESSLTQIDEFKNICLYEENFPVYNYINCIPQLKRIRVEGLYIELPDLVRFQKSLETIKAIVRFFKENENHDYSCLKKIISNIILYPFIFERLNAILNKNGQIKDNASKNLLTIRREIISKQKNVTRKLQNILKQAQKESIVPSDTEISIHNGRPVIPVPSEQKRRLRGYIHNESASGKTSFIEPAEIVEINNEIRELEYNEKREIIKILREFSDQLRPYIDDLTETYQILGLLDCIRAKALLALKINAVNPVVTSSRSFKWSNAVHPLLYLSHKAENKQTIPLDIRLDEKNRILVISGPNAGGKSVCLKTVGLLQYMIQCGLQIPVNENSETGIFKNIFIDIGDEQSLENDLSTYSGHLMNMKFFLKYSDENTIILIDEFGTGTEPALGGAIAEAILQDLTKRKVFGIITTHYSNLKHFASSTEGVINGAMLFDTHKIEPSYKLSIGEPGSSFAIDIARKTGISEEILKNASEIIGEERVEFDKHLREIIRDKQYLEKKRKSIKKIEKQLKEQLEKYDEKLEKIDNERKTILNDAKNRSENILESANKIIERTIREIKESQAEKEKTKEARNKLDVYKKDTDPFADNTYNSVYEKKRDETRQLKARINKFNPELKKEKKKESKENKKPEVGDSIYISGYNSEGEVLEINDQSILVSLGNMITTVDASRIEKIEKSGTGKKSGSSGNRSYGKDILKRKLSFTSEVDVRGKRGDEAIEIIRQFIDDAIVVAATELKILHGKGNGILRQLIRDYLKTVDVVVKYSDDHPDRGGAGITLVTLDLSL